ncbi:flagellar hook-associated protein FlgL [uncultured Amnibacterium sp.]|uniref:flagellar hook-associated protein FlgL n=1 Tax=uncultured Amnibacterium sp. TaxID=1631851 RepID=UPI0035C9B5CB
MSIGRITTAQIYSSSNASIQASKARLSQLTAQSSSGLLVAKPSDDPAAAASILRVRGEQAANAQYAPNISDGLGWLSTADTTMTASENLVRQAKDLTIQAANSGVSSPAARNAIAAQLEGIRDDLLTQANTKINGRSIFAGTSDASSAFDPTTFAYSGPTTSTSTTAPDGTVTTTTTALGSVQRRIGSGAGDTTTVSADGLAAFGSGTTSVFARIQSVIDALRSGTYDTDDSATGPKATVTSGIDVLNGALTSISAQHAIVGANYARMTSAKTQNATTATALETQRSGLQDADTTRTLLDLKTQELAYQTALQVTAQVIQPTLMSFLS